MGRPPIGKVAMSGAERVRRYRAKHGTDKPVTKHVTKHVTKPASPDHAALAKELAQAEARIAELEALGTTKAGADVAQLEAENAELRDENYKFRVELEARNHVFKTRSGGGLTKSQFGMLLKVYHPDNPASEKTRNECLRLVNQLRYVLCNEAELPSMDPQKFHISFQKLWEQRQRTIKEAKKAKAKRRDHQPKPPKEARKLRDSGR
jgi:hypothetical protein